MSKFQINDMIKVLDENNKYNMMRGNIKSKFYVINNESSTTLNVLYEVIFSETTTGLFFEDSLSFSPYEPKFKIGEVINLDNDSFKILGFNDTNIYYAMTNDNKIIHFVSIKYVDDYGSIVYYNGD